MLELNGCENTHFFIILHYFPHLELNIEFSVVGKWPTWRTITLYNTFIIIIIIIIIILYVFRATLCSSSGGQIVLMQHVV